MKGFSFLLGLALSVAIVASHARSLSSFEQLALDAERDLALLLSQNFGQQAAPKDDGNGCQLACTLLHDPVCGNNNVTYSNRCWMDVAIKCEGKTGLKVAHEGVC